MNDARICTGLQGSGRTPTPHTTDTGSSSLIPDTDDDLQLLVNYAGAGVRTVAGWGRNVLGRVLHRASPSNSDNDTGISINSIDTGETPGVDLSGMTSAPSSLAGYDPLHLAGDDRVQDPQHVEALYLAGLADDLLPPAPDGFDDVVINDELSME